MRVAFFNTKKYDRQYFDQCNKKFNFDITYFKPLLELETAKLAFGFDAICVFVHDDVSRQVLELLKEHGIKLIVLRCAGFNNVDIKSAQSLGVGVARVPAYSPQGVAEHALGLMLTLNRKIYKAYHRVREGNFSLEGLVGFELGSKTIGVVGGGKIGSVMIKILIGMGCKVLVFDPIKNEAITALGAQYVSFEELLNQSDVITLHAPLTKENYHLIDTDSIKRMKKGVMLINTSRGALIDTRAIITGLKSGRIGYLGLDVYEEEEHLFFEDYSEQIIQDDVFARLMTFPNVVITSHQAFLTDQALLTIAETTLQNVQDFQEGKLSEINKVSYVEEPKKKDG